MSQRTDVTAFTEAYAALNAQQKRAVDTIDGPVMVIAGPGTGKTQVLTLRIANILKETDTAPESILALTFTEAGAAAMRNRLRRFVGEAAYRIPIHTFHSFAGELIRNYPDAYPRIIGGQVINDLEAITHLATCLDDASCRLLRPTGNPDYYLKPLRAILAELKKEYVTPDRLAEIIAHQEETLARAPRYHEKGAHKGKERADYVAGAKVIAKNRELLFVYQRYESLLRAHQQFDFDDMIIETVHALSHDEDMLRDIQERYQYVLADEHQDVNGAQNRILELLASFHDRPNLFVVGDEKQAIYRFQGASLENFLYFEDRFPGTVTISLTQNYRSGQPILDTAHQLIAVPGGPLAALRLPLTAAAVPADTTQVTLLSYPHQAVEDAALIETVQEALKQGVPGNEIAVIVRTNQAVEHLTALFRHAGISVAPSADTDILHHPITAHIEALVRAIVYPHDEAALTTVLLGPYWGISPVDAASILAAQRHDRPLRTLLFTPTVRDSLTLQAPEALAHLVASITTAREEALSLRPQQVLANIIGTSGFLAAVTATDGVEATRVLRRLYDEVEHLVASTRATTLADIAVLFTQYRSHGVSLNAPFIHADTNAVQIMTAHKSKGLEFSLVCLPYLTDRTWGGQGKRSLFTVPYTGSVAEAVDPLDDENRLLYVAMTRAKHTLRCSYARTQVDGKTSIVSRLLEPLVDHLTTEEVSGEGFDPSVRIAPRAPHNLVAHILLPALRERGFSATSLNTFYKNPWDFFFRSVLRVPDVKSLSLLYGTAMHAVLEQITCQHTRERTLMSHADISALLERTLASLPITTADHARLHEKALAALVVYREHLEATLPITTREELKLRVVLQTGIPELPELPLSGTLDRLDFDATGNLVRIVDYKTGTAKSRNAIEGKTKGGDGAYKRQLVFYALLLSLQHDQRFITDQYTLSFVEPVRGQIKEEAFMVGPDEVATLKEEIIAGVETLLSGAFLTDHALAEASDYAHFARAMSHWRK
jgi:DNA helicase-2/ATP-dependent DNA helicase PcrA